MQEMAILQINEKVGWQGNQHQYHLIK